MSKPKVFYQSGEVPEIGDTIECVDAPPLDRVLKNGQQFVNQDSPDHFLNIGDSLTLQGWSASRFRLIARAASAYPVK